MTAYPLAVEEVKSASEEPIIKPDLLPALGKSLSACLKLKFHVSSPLASLKVVEYSPVTSKAAIFKLVLAEQIPPEPWVS